MPSNLAARSGVKFTSVKPLAPAPFAVPVANAVTPDPSPTFTNVDKSLARVGVKFTSVKPLMPGPAVVPVANCI